MMYLLLNVLIPLQRVDCARPILLNLLYTNVHALAELTWKSVLAFSHLWSRAHSQFFYLAEWRGCLHETVQVNLLY